MSLRSTYRPSSGTASNESTHADSGRRRRASSVSFKQVWPKRIDHCFISCTASGPNESRRAHKQFPPLAQAQAIFEVRVQPPRILGCLTLGSKPSLPARANIQSRKPALHRKILHRVRQCLANLSVFEQMGKMNGEQARKGGVASKASQGYAVPDRNLAQFMKSAI